MKKPSFIFCSVGLFLAVMMGSVLVFFVSRLPSQTGMQAIAGLSAPTTIMRDVHGVPHIFAGTLNDGFAALGYLHASDRLFQMEMMRRAGSGHLAEILGKDLVRYDKKIRALGFYTQIEDYYKGLSPDTRAALDAYASGVNAVLNKQTTPAEFMLLNFKPAPWKPWDGLIWAKMMAWQLSGNWEDEVLREQLLQKGVSKSQIEALYPVLDHDVPSITKPLEWAMRDESLGMGDELKKISIIPHSSLLIAHPTSLTPFFDHLPHTASNSYVIAGAHTKTGKPILANDPHLQLQSPILWYLARIVTPQGELKGATAAGLPFFPLGQNSHVAWGFTTSNIDVQDVTFVNEDTKFISRDEIIHVKDSDDVHVSVEENNQGVVLSGIVDDITAITPPHKKAMLQFTGFQKGDRTAQALYRMNVASNAKDIEAALGDYSVPPQNLVYADADGHVGYAAVGIVPQRSSNGFYAHENTVWRGVMATTPRMKDPSAGVILTANQAVVDDKACKAFSCAFARDWSEPYRAMRLEKLFFNALAAHETFDVLSASAAMLDITSAAAARFLPSMLRGVTAKNPLEQDVLAALRAWDASMLRDKPEPLIYHVWLDKIMQAQFGDVYTHEVMWPRMWALEHQYVSDAIIAQSFRDALRDLTQRHGAHWQAWHWGDEHVAPLAHPLWSHVPLINQLTSLQVSTDGDGYTLRRAAPATYSKPFEVQHGAGYRGVYDLAQPAQSLFSIAGGESGQIASSHYGDLRGAWNAGEFMTLTGDEKQLRDAGASEATFVP